MFEAATVDLSDTSVLPLIPGQLFEVLLQKDWIF